MCSPVFSGRQFQLLSTPKPVTPFGGLVSLISFFERIGLSRKINEVMPFVYASNNTIPPAQTLVAFLISVVAGARRLAHTDWLRADKALHALLGIDQFPGTDTVRNLFKRFRQGHIEEFWRPLWKWLLNLPWPMPAEGFSLDLDRTIFQRSGHQEGAKKFTTRCALAATAIIRCWRFWQRLPWFCTPGCAAATPAPPVVWWLF
jgi:hypothetical protein